MIKKKLHIPRNRVNKTGFKGCLRTANGNYQSVLAIRHAPTNKVVNFVIGTFETVEEAHQARINYIENLK